MRWAANPAQTPWEIAPREALAARRHSIDIANNRFVCPNRPNVAA
jgi:hypothetical protein